MDSPECVYAQTQAPMMPVIGHSTNASPAIARSAHAPAPHREPEQPQHVPVVMEISNHQAKRCLAVSPCCLRSSRNHSIPITRIPISRRIGKPIVAQALWSRGSRPKVGNCFSGLEIDSFWVWGNSEHCLLCQVFKFDRLLSQGAASLPERKKDI